MKLVVELSATLDDLPVKAPRSGEPNAENPSCWGLSGGSIDHGYELQQPSAHADKLNLDAERGPIGSFEECRQDHIGVLDERDEV